MKKRVLAVVCAAALLCTMLACVLSASAVNDEKVYFMSVNDVVLDLEADTMPRMVNGVLYVPYTMFEPNYTTGASLGVFTSYSRSKGAVIIYSRSGTLVFDLNANNSTFGGTTYRDAAIIRNSMVFVPVNFVCEMFGLEWSWLIVNYGYIIRVKNEDVVLSDRDFTDAAYYAVQDRYQRYLQSQAEAVSPSVDASPAPSTPGQSESSVDGAQVYLAFRMEDGEGFAGILEQLERYGAYGIFFCRPEELADRDDDIRSLLGSGHRIGLLLDADTLSGQMEQLERGKELLTHIARVETVFCLNTSLNGAGQTALAEEMCLWQTTLDATSEGRSVSRQAAVITGTVRAGRSYFALMDDRSQSAQALAQILSTLTEEGCEFRLVNEVVLKG